MPAAPPHADPAAAGDVPTPGAYIRVRRQAEGVTLDQVATVVGAEPNVEHRERVAWLRQVEADERVITGALVDLLGLCFPLDRQALGVLVAFHAGARVRPPQLCRLCRCSWSDACVHADGHPCGWSETDISICTRCEQRMAAAAAAPRGTQELAA